MSSSPSSRHAMRDDSDDDDVVVKNEPTFTSTPTSSRRNKRKSREVEEEEEERHSHIKREAEVELVDEVDEHEGEVEGEGAVDVDYDDDAEDEYRRDRAREAELEEKRIKEQAGKLFGDAIRDAQFQAQAINHRSDVLPNAIKKLELISGIGRVNKGDIGNLVQDASNFKHIAGLGLKQAQALNTSIRIDVNDFLAKFKQRFNDPVEGGIDWFQVGSHVIHRFRSIHANSFLKGVIGLQPVQKQKRKQQRRAVEAEVEVEPERAQSLNREKAAQSMTDGRVRLLYHHLPRLPTIYFDVIFHPTSFTQTVENIFDLSFLIKKVNMETRTNIITLAACHIHILTVGFALRCVLSVCAAMSVSRIKLSCLFIPAPASRCCEPWMRPRSKKRGTTSRTRKMWKTAKRAIVARFSTNHKVFSASTLSTWSSGSGLYRISRFELPSYLIALSNTNRLKALCTLREKRVMIELLLQWWRSNKSNHTHDMLKYRPSSPRHNQH